MRQKLTRQMSLFSVTARHDSGKELSVFSEILDATPEMLELVYNDLIRNRRRDTGRQGMTAEQVLRACVLSNIAVSPTKSLLSTWRIPTLFAPSPDWRWGSTRRPRPSRRT